MNQLRSLFSAEDVVKKGLLADIMYMSTANKDEAKSLSNPDDWKSSKGLRIYEVFSISITYSISRHIVIIQLLLPKYTVLQKYRRFGQFLL